MPIYLNATPFVLQGCMDYISAEVDYMIYM